MDTPDWDNGMGLTCVDYFMGGICGDSSVFDAHAKYGMYIMCSLKYNIEYVYM